jgi:TetR/AcrR family transcriptional repressor of nem operon
MDETIKWLTRVMEVGKREGEFTFTGDARAKALTILSSLQGARQMARIHGIDLLDDVVTQIRRDMGLTA